MSSEGRRCPGRAPPPTDPYRFRVPVSGIGRLESIDPGGGPNGMTDDIVRDLQEVIVSLCARLYEKKSAQSRAKKALETIA
ncbi:recombinase family protein [Candidatus Methylacidithermus pantelleriae]|nr:hypothetical protein [Candidatus Methylacidithermus pantelleriae]